MAASVVALLGAHATAASASEPLPQWTNDYVWSGGDGYVGWTASVESPNPLGYLLASAYGSEFGLATGLVGEMEYRPGGATWSYTAPGTTRIASAKMLVHYRNKLFAHHCLSAGLSRDSVVRDGTNHCSPPVGVDEGGGIHSTNFTFSDPSATPTSTKASFEIRMSACMNPADTPCSKWIPELELQKNGPVARLKLVEMVLVDDDRPSLVNSGPFYDLRDTYINGLQSYGLTVDATDPGAGIEQVKLQHIGGSELASADAPCNRTNYDMALGTRVCPESFRAQMAVNATVLPERANDFRSVGIDPARNAGKSDQWRIFVDRTGPAGVREIEADFDEESREAHVFWQEGADPPLPDGNPGSGTERHEYRYRRPGGDWTSWVSTTDNGFDLGNSFVGEQVAVEVRSFDAVDNVSVVVASSITVTAGACDDTAEEGDDSIDGRLHLGVLPDDTPIDSFTFTSPVSQHELLQALPAGVKVASLVERSNMSFGAVHTTGMSPARDQSLADAFQMMNVYLERDLDQLESEYQDERADATEADRLFLDRELSILDQQRVTYALYDGVPIKSIAIEHNPAVATQMMTLFAGRLDSADVTPVDGPADCEFENAQSASVGSRPSAVAQGRSAAASPTVRASTGRKIPAVDFERNYKWYSYSPPKMRLAVGRERYPKETNGKTQYGKVTARWRFESKSNRQYWLDDQRKRNAPRGMEAGLYFDQEDTEEGGGREGQNGPFGIPAWEQDEPNQKNADPSLYTASFRCQYPDDYDSPEPSTIKNELEGQYQLTVGQGCRPRNSKRYARWTHLLKLKDDAEDRVVGAIQAVHYRSAAHIGTAPVVQDRSEHWWCHDNKHGAPGSCRFIDHTKDGNVPEIRYTPSFVTPGSIPQGRNVATERRLVRRIKP